MICSKCGANIAPGKRFCGHCGEPCMTAPIQPPVLDDRQKPLDPQSRLYNQIPGQQNANQIPGQRPLNQGPAQQPLNRMPGQQNGQPVPPVYSGTATPPYRPAAAPAAAPARMKKEARPVTKGTKVLTMVLCILCAILTFVTCNLGAVRNTLSTESLQYFSTHFDVYNTKIPDGNGKSSTIPEMIYKNMDADMKMQCSAKDIGDVIYRTDALSFLASVLNRYTRYVTEGDVLQPVSSREIIKFIENKEGIIHEELGYWLNDRDYEGMNVLLQDLTHSLTLPGLKANGVDLELYHMLLSKWVYIGLIALCIGLFALILFLNRSDIKACLKRIAPVWIVVGGLLLLEFGGILFVRKQFPITDALLHSADIGMLVRGLTLLALSIGILIVFRKKKPAAAPAPAPAVK